MIFLDTSYIIGLIVKNDRYCDISKDIKLNLKHEAKMTNITVLVEVLNSLNKYNFQGVQTSIIIWKSKILPSL